MFVGSGKKLAGWVTARGSTAKNCLTADFIAFQNE